MNYTQQELADLCPEDVAEFIDNEVLPEYADGLNTAENVADFMIDEAIDRLRMLEIDCAAYHRLHAKVALIDPYIALSQNRKILVAFIQTVFDNWYEEREDSK
ncbi:MULTISPECIES: hypothetical protein [Enterococcus]|uniref:Uncharacterized protein n=1 Tax=Candidatus Enterococcus mangumiae TaxID=2230878 RepID=A0ABZ2SYF4_9ENTE|nr:MULTISPECIES: hypothetical protein [unclassified Enterococcus]MBO0490346.1 hypothetical protein [Enterococcus sp. DIV1094]MBO1298941.1 hypothetical protein [Enterococcus sp. DIV1271a]